MDGLRGLGLSKSYQNLGFLILISLSLVLIFIGCATIPPVTEKRESTPSPEPVRYLRYIVQKGDTLWKIANMAYNDSLKWPRIFQANKDKIKDVHNLRPGEIINIPIE